MTGDSEKTTKLTSLSPLTLPACNAAVDRMPRFTDEWLYERVMFDYTTGGGASACACCQYNPDGEEYKPATPLAWFGGWRSFVDAIPDLPQENAEDFEWPQLESVWADRVKIRHKLLLRQRELVGQDDGGFQKWLEESRLGVPNENTMTLGGNSSYTMTIPREPFFEWIVTGFNIHTIYSHIIYVSMEQVAHFHLTKYADEGDDMERTWQHCIRWKEHDSFVISLHPSMLGRYQILRSQGDKHWMEGPSRNPTESDRRLVRLLMAQYVASQLHAEYMAEMKVNSVISDGSPSPEEQ